MWDILTTTTYDEARGITYPAWTVVNSEDIKRTNRALQVSNNAVPVMYSVNTSSSELLYSMITNAKNIIDKHEVSLLMDIDDGVEYLNENYNFFEETNGETRSRLLNPYAQTKVFINEAINLEQYIQGGYIKLKEKSGRRKDRVMSLIYGLWYCKILEDELNNKPNDSILDWIQWA